MYENFGAIVTESAVEFRLFFPDSARDPAQYSVGGVPRIQKLQVIGDFQRHIGGSDWDPASAPELVRSPHPAGWLYTFTIPQRAENRSRSDRATLAENRSRSDRAALPDGFYQYRYFVTFENGEQRRCSDPCAKYVGDDENAGFVIGGNDTVVRPLANRLPLRDLIIYELMIDDFTAGFRGTKAPVDAVRDRIDHLVELGINAVEFMPWVAWPGGDFSWGYNPYLFFAVENRYIEDPSEPLDRLYRLKTLINALHDRGIQVIMDGVFNHVNAGLNPERGFPYHWLYQDPRDSPFTGRFVEGEYFEDLDYNNGCTQQFILDVCKYWLDEYQLDGIRFDYTLGFFETGEPARGITKLVGDLRAHLAGQGRDNVALILEHLSENRYEAIDVANQVCATGCWYDRLFYDVPGWAASGNVETSVVRVLDTARDFAEGKGPVTYVENHDHSTLINRMGGRDRWWRAQPPLLALFTCSGGVLIHNGQEFGDNYYLPGSGSERVQPRPLHWEWLTDEVGSRLFDLHKRLIRLRKDCPSLRSANHYPRDYDERQTHFNAEGYGVDTDRDVVIYHRWGQATDGQLERFIIVVNFSGYEQQVDVPFPANGGWQDRLSGDVFQVTGFRLAGHRIPSHWGKVFYRKG